MSDMIERVATAMCARAGADWADASEDQYAPPLANRPFWRQQARAAIAAMREPTQKMIDAVDLGIPTEGQITDTWRAMIGAALADGPA